IKSRARPVSSYVSASLSFIERRLSICLHRRKIRPMSYWPILPTPLVGGCTNARIDRNCINIRLGFAELFLRLVNPLKFPFVGFANICTAGLYFVRNKPLLFFRNESRFSSRVIIGFWRGAE